ncbi:MAG: hypothetical protein ACI4R8_01070 [Candidatus Caccovivens sp.]
MTAEEIIRVISLSVSLLISFIGFVITFIKWIKNVIKTKNWNALKSALKEFITKAEGFVNFTGAEKKEIVLAWATNFCSEQGMKFDSEKVSAEIEDLVTLTKQVNQREKDKVATVEVTTTESKTPEYTVGTKKEGE